MGAGSKVAGFFRKTLFQDKQLISKYSKKISTYCKLPKLVFTIDFFLEFSHVDVIIINIKFCDLQLHLGQLLP